MILARPLSRISAAPIDAGGDTFTVIKNTLTFNGNVVTLAAREVDWIVAVGLGGRFYVVPTLDLVVVINAGLYHSPLQG